MNEIMNATPTSPWSQAIRAAVCIGALSGSVFSQAQGLSEALSGTVEVGALNHQLTAGYPEWRHTFVRGNVRSSANNSWDAEVLRAERFGDSGTLFVLGNTHHFDERWYGNVGISGSSGGFFLPSLRADITANRKWGARSNLITTFGFTVVDAKDVHRDRSVLLGLTYYFDAPVILQTGTRMSRSNPGAVNSRSDYFALTYGSNKKYLVSLLHSRGNEAYQLIGANALLVDINSNTSTATWRQWLSRNQGFQLRAEAYGTAFYKRRGLELAFFHEFE